MPGRPRKPTAIHELTGSFKKDPKRGRARAAEPCPDGEIGFAPKHLLAEELLAWQELVDMAAPGVLTASDRWIVELTCRLMAESRSADGLPTSKLSQLIRCLSQLGLTPADRSKISLNKKEDKSDPWDEL